MGEYNHYIRLDGEGTITMAFSDAFLKPEIGDVCVAQNTAERHYNPALRDANGNLALKWDPAKRQVLQRTDAAKEPLAELRAKAKATLMATAEKIMAKTRPMVEGYLEETSAGEATTIDATEFGTLVAQRKAVRLKLKTALGSVDTESDRDALRAAARDTLE